MSAARKLDSISDYLILDTVGEGAFAEVFKVERHGDVFALKLVKSPEGTEKALKNFRREAFNLNRIHKDGVYRIYEIGSHGDKPYAVQSFIDGVTLSKVISSRRLSSAETLQLGHGLARVLAEIHATNLLHRDLKPDNIIVRPKGEPVLIDFGLSDNLSLKIDDSLTVMGTPLYASPEQMGMLNRPIDARSDLYSLGVILYECIAGRRPFESDNMSDVLRMHATEAPPLIPLPADSPTASTLVSIVFRLLEKDPDRRYQSASSLASDLAKVLAGHTDFEIASSKVKNETLPLIGRETELRQLETAIVSARSMGQTALLFARGEPGIGKSRLLDEFLDKQNLAYLFFAKAQHGDATPFSVIRKALEQWLFEVDRSPRTERDRAISCFQRAAGTMAPYIAKVSPEIAKILKVDKPQDLATIHQFYEVMGGFFSSLLKELSATNPDANGKAVCALFLDDFQWFDAASREILKHTIRGSEGSGTLFLISARSEIPVAQIKEFAGDMGNKCAFSLFDITGLTAIGSRDVVKSMLGVDGSGGDDLEPIAQAVFQSSKGNPFVITEYLRALIEYGAVRLTAGAWRYSKEAIDKINLPSDVISLVLRRLESLSNTDLEILGHAALFGARISVPVLIETTGLTETALLGRLQTYYEHGILEKAGDSYQFIHDRIREALRTRHDAQSLVAAHDALASAVETVYSASGDETLLYSLATHAAQGSRRDLGKVYAFNAKAGNRALDEFSVDLAKSFLSVAEVCANESGAKPDWELYRALGYVSNYAHDVKSAKHYYLKAVEHCKDRFERAKLFTELGVFGVLNIDDFEMKEYIGKACADLGLEKPGFSFTENLKENFRLTLEIFRYFLGFKLSEEEIRRRKVVHKIYALQFWREYFGMDTLVNEFMSPALSLFKIVRNGLRLPKDSFENHDLDFFVAMIICGFRVEPLARWAVNRATRRAEATKNPFIFANVVTCWMYYGAVFGDQKRLAGFNDTFWEKLGYIGSERFAVATAMYAFGFSMRGRYREVMKLYDLTLKLFSSEEMDHYLQKGAPTYVATGDAAAGLRLMNQEDLPESRWGGIRYYNRDTLKLNYLYEMHQFDGETKKVMDEYHTPNLKRDLSYFFLGCYDHVYFLRAYTCAYFAMQAKTAEERKEWVKRLESNFVFMTMTAAGNPMLMSHLQALQGFVQAAKGKFKAAEKKFEKAMKLGDKSESPLTSYECLVFRAHFGKAAGKSKIAVRSDVQAAYALASEHGWRKRQEHLRKTFPNDFNSSPEFAAGAVGQSLQVGMSIAVASTRQGMQGSRTLEAFLTLSKALGEIDPETQARTILDQLIKLFGAERAFLMEIRGETMNCLAGRDSGAQDIVEPKGFSRSIMQKAQDEKRAFLVSGNDDGEVQMSESMLAFGLKSIMVTPVLKDEDPIAVIYLDNSVSKGVFTEQKMELFAQLSHFLSVNLRMASAAKVELEKKTLEKDLAVTEFVQKLIIPKQNEISTGSFDLTSYYRPQNLASGDWFWYEQMSEDKLFMLVGDVTGHGPGPAMLTTAVASAYRTVKALSTEDFDLLALVKVLNTTLFSLVGGEFHMTGVVGILDTKAGKFTFINAAHRQCLVVGNKGENGEREIKRVQTAPGNPLGEAPEVTFELNEHQLLAGETLFLYTDGIIEAEDGTGRQFGVGRLSSALKGDYDSTAALMKGLVERFNKHAEFVDDDITLLAVKYKGVQR